MSTSDPKPPADARPVTEPPQWLVYLFVGPMIVVALAGIVAIVITLAPKSS